MRSCRRVTMFWTSIVATLTAATPVGALTIDAGDRGWYDITGLHQPMNENYLVGNLGDSVGGDEHRNFFVFDLSELSMEITSATLHIFNFAGGYSSPDTTENYSVFDVSTPISALISGNGGVPAWADLGSGIQL